LVGIAARLAIPIFVSEMIKFVDPRQKTWDFVSGLGLAFIIFGLSIASAVTAAVAQSIMVHVSQSAQAYLLGLVYEKAFRISAKSRIEFSDGVILNLVTADVGQVQKGISIIPLAFTIPIEIGFLVYFLWMLVGPAFLAGAGVVLLVGVASILNAKSVSTNIQAYIKAGDGHLSAVREFLLGIKFIKYQALEDFFLNRITKARDNQVHFLKNVYFYLAGIQILTGTVPNLITVSTFAVYSINNRLDASIIFPALIYLTSFQAPIHATTWV
jgi:ATP-binding cassette, subfamily C (CFTR/MRP), member 1